MRHGKRQPDVFLGTSLSDLERNTNGSDKPRSPLSTSRPSAIHHHTAEFAVDAIRWCSERLRQKPYPHPGRLLVTAVSGSSNSPRTPLWRSNSHQLRNQSRMTTEVCHAADPTKWNKIEHRLFRHITRNGQRVPFDTLEIMVQRIGSTRSRERPEIHAWLDEREYLHAKTVSPEKLSQVPLPWSRFNEKSTYQNSPAGEVALIRHLLVGRFLDRGFRPSRCAGEMAKARPRSAPLVAVSHHAAVA